MTSDANTPSETRNPAPPRARRRMRDPRALRRLRNCIGKIMPLVSGEYRITPPIQGLVCHAGMTLQDVAQLCADPDAGHSFTQLAEQPDKLHRTLIDYVEPALRWHRAAGIDRPFLLVPGDTRSALAIPGFAKTRTLWAPGNTLLLPLRLRRHFGRLTTVDAADVPFDEKLPRLVWRGSTTDAFVRRRNRPHLGSRYSIMAVRDRADPVRFDVGYSSITVEPRQTERPVEELERYRVDALSMAEQLTYRYILCLEGNDVSSGLKWALYANSVVLMPHPGVESWACESFLKPYEHFVPVRADLSDLEAQVDWCDGNPDDCRRIAAAGREFITQFLDNDHERALAQDVVKAYHSRVRLRLDRVSRA